MRPVPCLKYQQLRNKKQVPSARMNWSVHAILIGRGLIGLTFLRHVTTRMRNDRKYMTQSQLTYASQDILFVYCYLSSLILQIKTSVTSVSLTLSTHDNLNISHLILDRKTKIKPRLN